MKVYKVTGSLPYCLHLEDGYKFKITGENGEGAVFSFKQIKQTQIDPRLSLEKVGDAELITDKMGLLRYTDFNGELFFSVFPERKLLSKYLRKKIVFFLNKLISIYRYLTKEFYIELLLPHQIYRLNISYKDDRGRNKGIIDIHWGMGLAKVPIFEGNLFIEIQRALDQNFIPPLQDELLLNASDYCFSRSNYRMCILESVIALEIVLSDLIYKKGTEKGIDEDSLDNFIKNVGLTGNVKVTLKLLIDNADALEDEVYKKVKGAITIRNKIMHKRLREVSHKDAEDALLNTHKMIEFIQKQ